MIAFMFFYLIYLQVFIGALINWDNVRFVNSPKNFGANGNLDFDDQINIIFGFFFFAVCMMFPVLVWYVMHLNYAKLMMKKKDRAYHYNALMMLNEELRDNIEPQWNYFFVCVLRRCFFGISAYYMGAPENSTFQIVINMILSVLFACYLLEKRLFKEEWMQYCQVFNELLILVINYHQLLYSDFVDDPMFKYNAGSWMISFCFIYMVFPNLFLLIKEWFVALALFLRKKGYIDAKKFAYIKHCEEKRREFINANRNIIKIKPEAIKEPVATSKSQVAPEVEKKTFKTTFELRAFKQAASSNIRHLFPVEDRDAIKQTIARVDLTKIQEEPSG